MRDLPCPARISCRLGSGFQRTQNNQPPGNADAVFDVSIRGPALDRPARRADAAHDFSERPRAREHVSPVLSGFTGLVALKQHVRGAPLSTCLSKKCGNKTRAQQVSVAMTHIAVSNVSEHGQKSSVCLPPGSER